MNDYFEAAVKLHQYTVTQHWDGQALVGPDPGIRFNYRIGRFVKNYARIGFKDDTLYYVQAQGYWVLANWRLFDLTGDMTYQDIAVRCSHTLLDSQRADGAWEYPNPEWKGRIATAEGTWGSLGLLESFRRTQEQAFLDGVLAWYHFLIFSIGFQQIDETTAVNYFAHQHGERVPNNSAIVLRFLALLGDTMGDLDFLQQCSGLVRFLIDVQKASGELPYMVSTSTEKPGRVHFQCFQYNAFQCLDLLRYYELTKNRASLPILDGLLHFLPTGIGQDGHAFYDCGNRHRSVVYHSAALAAALLKGYRLGFTTDSQRGIQAYEYVLRSQRPDGGFPYSSGDYRVLKDQRSYPRYLAMILVHLLEAQELRPISLERVRPLGDSG